MRARVLVLVEGQTEEEFVNRVLAPHLDSFGVFPTPVILKTKRTAGGPDHKGGVGNWEQIRRDLNLLLGDSSAVAVTTLIDFYGLPSDVPGAELEGSAADSVVGIERAISADLANDRLHPYLALHEFESMLFVDPDKCGEYLSSSKLSRQMTRALSQCGEPEKINDDPSTAPSKRILSAFPQYQKVQHGPALIQRIGLTAIRAQCPHFADWLGWLESLTND